MITRSTSKKGIFVPHTQSHMQSAKMSGEEKCRDCRVALPADQTQKITCNTCNRTLHKRCARLDPGVTPPSPWSCVDCVDRYNLSTIIDTSSSSNFSFDVSANSTPSSDPGFTQSSIEAATSQRQRLTSVQPHQSPKNTNTPNELQQQIASLNFQLSRAQAENKNANERLELATAQITALSEENKEYKTELAQMAGQVAEPKKLEIRQTNEIRRLRR